MKTAEERLRELLAINTAITGAASYDEVLHLVVDKAYRLIEAEACVLLLAEPGAPAAIVAAVGVANDKTRDFQPVLDERIDAALSAHLGLSPQHRILGAPMVVRGDLRGVLAVVLRRAPGATPQTERADKDDEFLLSALADQAAIALGQAAHVQELEVALATSQLLTTMLIRRDQEQHLLAEAGATLGSTLDYEAALSSVARLVVRDLADLCIIDLIGDGQQVRRLTVVHADPAKSDACEALSHLRLDPRRFHLGADALATGQPAIVSDWSPKDWAANAQSPEHLRLLETLEPRSIMAVPMRVHGRTLGALVFGSSRPGRHQQGDLPLAEELARRAALAVENGRLYQTATRATQLRDEVLGIVAHDLRNPLSSISLAARLLTLQLADMGATTGQKSVETILRAARRATRLIEDLLDVTRMEARRLTLEPHRVATTQVLRDGAEAQQGLASAAGIELRLEAQPDLPEIWADRDRILQVLENLVSNAIKHTDKGGHITIGAAPRGEVVLFSVADTGTGIEAEHLPYVFDRFWQAQTKAHHGGGLGLPICKGIVEAHGGRIWIESTPGHGAIAYFTIPTAASIHGEAVASHASRA